MSTAICAAAVAAAIIAVICKMIKDKKRGKTSCGCDCSVCPRGSLCKSRDKENCPKD